MDEMNAFTPMTRLDIRLAIETYRIGKYSPAQLVDKLAKVFALAGVGSPNDLAMWELEMAPTFISR